MTSSAAAATAASAEPGPEDGVASAGWPTSSQHSHPGFGFDAVNPFARAFGRALLLPPLRRVGASRSRSALMWDLGGAHLPLKVAFFGSTAGRPKR